MGRENFKLHERLDAILYIEIGKKCPFRSGGIKPSSDGKFEPILLRTHAPRERSLFMAGGGTEEKRVG